MMGEHWTEQEFINDIYGIGPGDGHLQGCAECRARREELAVRRQAAAREPEVPGEFLAAQRRAIHEKLGERRVWAVRWAPAFAAVFVLLIGVFLMRESRSPVGAPAPVVTAADSQLFSDIYALEGSSEPQAVTPVRALFEEN